MLKLFKSDSNLQLLLLVIFASIMWIPAFLSPNITPQTQIISFYNELGINIINNQILVVLGFVVLLIECLLVFFLVRENDLGIKKSWLIPLIFLFVNSSNTALCYLSATMIANFFVILAMMYLLLIDQFKNELRTVLTISILIGFALLFQFAFIQYLLVLVIGLLILGKAGWRQLQIIIIGFFLSILVYAFVHFMIGDLQEVYNSFFMQLGSVYDRQLDVYNLNYTHYIFAFILLVSLISITYSIISYKDRTVLGKKKKNLFIVVFFINILSFFGFLLNLNDFFVIISLPIAFFIGILWLNIKENRLTNLLFLLFFAVFLVNNYIQHFLE